MAEVVALFPLSEVLLPGMPLPLRIFEPRYRALLADVSASPGGARFGVVALRSGTEALTPHVAAGPPDVEAVGTLAEVLEVSPQDDGGSELLCVGSRRFRIESLIEEGRPYLRAAVEYLDEDDVDPGDPRATLARRLMRAYDARLVRLAGRATGAELPGDTNQLAYHIGARLPLPPADRQLLLGDATTADRLARLVRLLRRELTLLERTRSIAVSPAVVRMGAGAN